MKLNTLFQNGAVFQQSVPIPVWGKTEPWHKVKCEFAGQEIYSKSNESGKFLLRFAPVPAGGPYTLTVTDLISGEIIRVEDILVGEVWVASGQSNMSYTLGDDATVSVPEEIRVPAKVNREQEAEFCATIPTDRQTRFITLPRVASGLHEESFDAEWKHLTPETAPQLSAAAAWFGRYIQEKKDVPVGLIVTAWGGTRVEAWTSRAGLRSNPETAALLGDLDENMQQNATWNESDQPVPAEGIPDPGNTGFALGYADPNLDDSEWSHIKIPGSWINQKISGNGAIWVRTTINLPAEWCGKELVLELGAIDKQDTTYFNGVQIGKSGEGMDSSFWCKPRRYTIPANLVHPGRNDIAVRAFSFLYDGAFLGRRAEYGIRVKDTGEFISITENWKTKVEVDFGRLTPSDVNPAPGNPNTPGILFDSMICPLLPYAIRGAIWYQGESNATTLDNSRVYLERMKTMIRDWRYRWELGNFPFIQVQLANFKTVPEPDYNPQSPWALIRENQALACQEPNTYMASAVDIGCSTDIHPQDKKSVGKRLAAIALHHVYNVPGITPTGPVFEKAIPEPGQIRLSFRYGDGLQITGDVAKSFVIAGSSGIFHPADWYQIDGTSLILGSRNVKDPCDVRYCWTSDPKAILFNGEGLPAAPFRTDSYAIVD